MNIVEISKMLFGLVVEAVLWIAATDALHKYIKETHRTENGWKDLFLFITIAVICIRFMFKY